MKSPFQKKQTKAQQVGQAAGEVFGITMVASLAVTFVAMAAEAVKDTIKGFEKDLGSKTKGPKLASA